MISKGTKILALTYQFARIKAPATAGERCTRRYTRRGGSLSSLMLSPARAKLERSADELGNATPGPNVN
eukprot:6559379-Prymnesium_polylepis.1